MCKIERVFPACDTFSGTISVTCDGAVLSWQHKQAILKVLYGIDNIDFCRTLPTRHGNHDIGNNMDVAINIYHSSLQASTILPLKINEYNQ